MEHFGVSVGTYGKTTIKTIEAHVRSQTAYQKKTLHRTHSTQEM